MADCPEWTNERESRDQLRSVANGLAEFHRFIIRKSTSHILLHGDLKTWHERVFKDVVPLPYYAGNYRSDDPRYPCLAKDVQVGSHGGAPYQDVPRLMREFSDEVLDAVKRTDRYVSLNPTPTDRARAVVQLAAFYAGRFIRIHPFLNGNGRMSRLIVNYIFQRYGYPLPYYSPFPRPPADYAAAFQACMSGDLNPLYWYLLTSLASTATD